MKNDMFNGGLDDSLTAAMNLSATYKAKEDPKLIWKEHDEQEKHEKVKIVLQLEELCFLNDMLLNSPLLSICEMKGLRNPLLCLTMKADN